MRLSGINYRVGSEQWLRDIDLSLVVGGINVLLGATLAGKTTLLRIMAGLDRPTLTSRACRSASATSRWSISSSSTIRR